jgi:hypothetical protein
MVSEPQTGQVVLLHSSLLLKGIFAAQLWHTASKSVLAGSSFRSPGKRNFVSFPQPGHLPKFFSSLKPST